jgi:hypothetical protein
LPESDDFRFYFILFFPSNMANVGQFFHPKTKSFVEAALGLFFGHQVTKNLHPKKFAATKWSSALLCSALSHLIYGD